jgi:hypothetical protein
MDDAVRGMNCCFGKAALLSSAVSQSGLLRDVSACRKIK